MTTKKTETNAASVAAKKTAVKKAAPTKARTAAKPAAKPVPVAPAAKKPKVKEPKVKVVRDSFTMPQGEYQKIAEIKEVALKAGVPVKKSEVLRAGLKALAAMSPARLKVALAGLEKIKTGRPKKH